MKTKIISLFILLIVLIALASLFSSIGQSLPKPQLPGTDQSNTNGDEQVFCTLDAKICPDGSYVGRVPPSCNFAQCPDSSSDSSADSENQI